MIVYRRHLAVSPVSKFPYQLPGRHVLGKIRLKGTELIIGAVYGHSGAGAAGDNLAFLKELGADLKGRGLPFILAGDWNMDPEEMASAG